MVNLGLKDLHTSGWYHFVGLSFVVFLLFVLGNKSVFADTTSALRPAVDGSEDSASWQNTSGSACNGIDCYFEVDESSGEECTNSDGNTSYVFTNANGASQTFDLDESSIPNGAVINQIDITVCARRTQGGASIQTRRCTDGSCVSFGSDITPSNSYTENTQSYTGLSITKSALSDLEIGIQSTAAKGVRVSQVSAVVTYAPAVGNDVAQSLSSYARPDYISITFSGFAYPSGSIEFFRRNRIGIASEAVPVSVKTINNDGSFLLDIGQLIYGDYLFTLRAFDEEGGDSGVIAFSVDFFLDELKLKTSDIFLPPTLSFDRAIVSQGEKFYVRGFGSPLSEISLYIDGDLNATTTTNGVGGYNFSISTELLNPGVYTINTKQKDLAEPPRFNGDARRVSGFSLAKKFKISALMLPRADFNEDNRVDITDWSVV